MTGFNIVSYGQMFFLHFSMKLFIFSIIHQIKACISQEYYFILCLIQGNLKMSINDKTNYVCTLLIVSIFNVLSFSLLQCTGCSGTRNATWRMVDVDEVNVIPRVAAGFHHRLRGNVVVGARTFREVNNFHRVSFIKYPVWGSHFLPIRLAGSLRYLTGN